MYPDKSIDAFVATSIASVDLDNTALGRTRTVTCLDAAKYVEVLA